MSTPSYQRYPEDRLSQRSYRPPARRRAAARRGAPVWARLVAAAGVLVTMVGIGGIAVAKYYLAKLTSNIGQTDSALGSNSSAGKGVATGKLPDGPIDLLMLGLDTRPGWEKEGMLSRSDTIIILHISASHDQAYMISIPRDTWTNIPADASLGATAATEKINAAFAWGSDHGHGWAGGARLAAEAVHDLTGISFDGVIVIDFSGFSKVINAINGVYMCVERDTWSSHFVKGPDGKPVYKTWPGDYQIPNVWIHKAGCRDMEGWEALDYARQRYGLPNGDYDRERHQQQLLRAMAKKATSAGVLTDPAKLSDLVAAAGSSLNMDTHGVPITDFVFGLKAIAAADLMALKTNGGTFFASGGGEGITPATLQMFEAAKNDNLGQFVVDNPEFLIGDTPGTPIT